MYEYLGTNGVRLAMESELELDVAAQTTFFQQELPAACATKHLNCLQRAIQDYDAQWYVQALAALNIECPCVQNLLPAASKQAEEEFHRYYIRGLCLLLGIQNSKADVEICARQEPVSSKYKKLIGLTFPAYDLLRKIREFNSLEKALGLTTKNSGLSIKRV